MYNIQGRERTYLKMFPLHFIIYIKKNYYIETLIKLKKNAYL